MSDVPERVEQMMYQPQVTFYMTKAGALSLAADLIKQAMDVSRPEQQHIKLWFNGRSLCSWSSEIAEAAEM